MTPRDTGDQFPSLSELRLDGREFVDPAVLDRPIGEPVPDEPTSWWAIAVATLATAGLIIMTWTGELF